MPERTITVASVVKDDYENRISWNVETTERIGMVKCWSFPPGPEIAAYLNAHLMEPITVTVSEKDKTSKAGKPYKQVSVLGIPGVIEPAKSPQNGSQGQGKGSWRESWNQSEEGQRFQAERSDRRTALMTAGEVVKNAGSTSGALIEGLAEDFYRWLQETIRDGSGSASQPPSPGASRPEHSSGRTDVRVGEGAAAPGQGNGPGSEAVSAASEPGLQSLEAGQATVQEPPLSTPAPASDPLAVPIGAFRGKTFVEWAQKSPGTLRSVLRAKNDLTDAQVAEAVTALEKVGA